MRSKDICQKSRGFFKKILSFTIALVVVFGAVLPMTVSAEGETESDASLYAHLDFEAPIDGVFKTKGTNQKTYTLVGKATHNPRGISGYGVSMSTQSVGYAATENIDFTFNNGHSISMWVRGDVLSSSWTGALITKGTKNTAGHFEIVVSSKVFQIYGQEIGTTSLGLNCADITNGWHHLAFVWENNVIKSYVDGTLKATSAAITKSVTTTNTPIYVGAVSNNSLPFTGIIDEVKLYTRAIAASEVTALAEEYEPTYLEMVGISEVGTVIEDSDFCFADDTAIQFWFNAKTFTQNQQFEYILSRGTKGQAGHFQIYTRNGNLEFYGENQDSTESKLTAENYVKVCLSEFTGGWHMLTMVNKDSKFLFYVDGELVSSVDSSSHKPYATTMDILVGKYGATAFSGTMIDFELMTTAPDAAAVRSAYTQAIAAQCTHTNITPASCIAEGKCQQCGKIYPMVEHKWSAGKCSVCGKADPLAIRNTVGITRIVCVGDSITANGYWKNTLMGNLDSSYEVIGFGRNSATGLAAGTNGGTPLAYKDTVEYENSVRSLPDAVVVMLGTNDTKTENYDKIVADNGVQYVKDIVALIESYQGLASNPQVFVALPIKVVETHTPTGIDDARLTNTIIPLLIKAAEETGAVVIDTHTATEDATLDNFADGIHPSDDIGREMIAKAIAEGIKSSDRELPKLDNNYFLGIGGEDQAGKSFSSDFAMTDGSGLQFWFKANSFNATGFNAFFARGANSASNPAHMQLYTRNGNLEFYTRSGLQVFRTLNLNMTRFVGDWHLLTLTYSKGVFEVYVDGVLLGRDAWSYTSVAGTQNIHVGVLAEGNFKFDGSIIGFETFNVLPSIKEIGEAVDEKLVSPEVDAEKLAMTSNKISVTVGDTIENFAVAGTGITYNVSVLGDALNIDGGVVKAINVGSAVLLVQSDDGKYIAGAVIKVEDDSVADDHEHIYDKQIATEKYLSSAATYTTPATYFKSCSCGEAGSDIFYGEVKAIAISGSNLTVGKDLTMNFYLPKDITPDIKIRATMNGEPVVLDGEMYGELYKFSYKGIAPQCMGDGITVEAVVVDENNAVTRVLVAETDHGITAYFNKLLAKTAGELGISEEKYAVMKTLIADILNYGAAAQNYKGYKTDALVNEGVTGGTAFEALTTTDMSITGTAQEGVSFYSATVYYDNTNKLYFRLKAEDLSGLCVVIKRGDSIEKVVLSSEFIAETNGQGETVYSIYSYDIYATDFDAVFTATFYRQNADQSVEGQSLTYSVNSYVYSKQNDGEGELSETAQLARAMYCYGVSSETYYSMN